MCCSEYTVDDRPDRPASLSGEVRRCWKTNRLIESYRSRSIRANPRGERSSLAARTADWPFCGTEPERVLVNVDRVGDVAVWTDDMSTAEDSSGA